MRDDEIGYGIASATHMFTVDPAQYPDVNPLLVDDGTFPLLSEITPTATPSGDDQPAGNGAGFLWVVVIVAAVVGLLVLVGIIVLVVVLATRRRGASSGSR